MNEIDKNNAYTELFLAEALENFTEINNLLTKLERNPGDQKNIHALFRIAHTLKGNASGLGYDKISDLTHTLEEFFVSVREQQISLQPEHFTILFRCADVLGQLINSVKTAQQVNYLGIKTALDVMISQRRDDRSTNPAADVNNAEVSPNALSSGQEFMDEVEFEPSSLTISDLVQVPVKKLDNLLNLVGELVIERDRIVAMTGSNKSTEYSRLNRISSDLQYSVMDVRLVQVGFLFNKFLRIVRDASVSENKSVKLKLAGTDTEIDRNILQTISDALIHLIRNAVVHGIEDPDQRHDAGKPKEGIISLSARSESETVIITVEDDGGGIDPEFIRSQAIKKGIITETDCAAMTTKEIMNLIFAAGFSTLEQATSIAGRGVGMDVVKKRVEAVGGTVDVESTIGKGTIFTLSLPSSMAVKSTLLCELKAQTYAIPLSHTDSVISLSKKDLHKTAQGLLAVHLGTTIHVVFLADLFNGDAELSEYCRLTPGQKIDVVVVSFNRRKIGLVVDRLLQQKEIVERPLSKPFDSIGFLSGTTILGNGSVCLSLNIPGLLAALFSKFSFSNLTT
jgi:two-component system, chemotaxis family, sensor kinase CheA